LWFAAKELVSLCQIVACTHALSPDQAAPLWQTAQTQTDAALFR
jgi:hypothetical protein